MSLPVHLYYRMSFTSGLVAVCACVCVPACICACAWGVALPIRTYIHTYTHGHPVTDVTLLYVCTYVCRVLHLWLEEHVGGGLLVVH